MTKISKRFTLRHHTTLTGLLAVIVLASCQQSSEEPSVVGQLEQNKALVRQSIEAMDRGDWESFLGLHAPDYVSHYPGQPQPVTREEHTALAKEFYASYPDAKHTIHESIAQDDYVVVRLTDRGTALDGTPIEFGVISMYRIADGKIAEVWMQGDILGLNRQLGMELVAKEAQ